MLFHFSYRYEYLISSGCNHQTLYYGDGGGCDGCDGFDGYGGASNFHNNISHRSVPDTFYIASRFYYFRTFHFVPHTVFYADCDRHVGFTLSRQRTCVKRLLKGKQPQF